MVTAMSRFGPSGWKANTLKRANTNRSSIRGRISGPIQIMVENEEFPTRTRGATITTPFGLEDIEEQLRTPKSNVNVQHVEPFSRDMDEPSMAASEAASFPTSPIPVLQAAQVTPPREAMASISLESNMERPRRTRSSIRSVFGRLFGRKNKNGVSVRSNGTPTELGGVGLHHSVSCVCNYSQDFEN
jgi:hypothetical protein